MLHAQNIYTQTASLAMRHRILLQYFFFLEESCSRGKHFLCNNSSRQATKQASNLAQGIFFKISYLNLQKKSNNKPALSNYGERRNFLLSLQIAMFLQETLLFAFCLYIIFFLFRLYLF